MKIKICGIKNEDELKIINEACPDFIGFIFAKSKREITFNKAIELKKMLNPKIKAVGVFVDTPILEIVSFYKKNAFDIAQLHGEYSEDDILKLKSENIPVIKVIRVQEEAYNIETKADYVLFDNYKKNITGGTNEAFNWNIKIKSNVPYFIAGGLNQDNIKAMAQKLHPYAADVSSGVEVDGFKTKEKVFNIIKITKELNL